MAMSHDAIRRRIERIEQRQKQQVAEMVARIQERTGWSLDDIVAEVNRIATYYRQHGEWPAEVWEALRSPPVMEIRLRWRGDDHETGDDVESASATPVLPPAPAPDAHIEAHAEARVMPAPDPEVDEVDAELAALVHELRQRLRAR